METVMAVFSSVIVPQELAEYSIKFASDKGAKLILLDVRTKETSGKALRITCDFGFLGNKIRDSLEEQISESRNSVIHKKLDILEHKAKELGVSVQIIIIEGPYIKSILEVAKKYKVSTIIAEALKEKIESPGFSVIDIKTVKED